MTLLARFDIITRFAWHPSCWRLQHISLPPLRGKVQKAAK
jgi:hypothetical protein